MARGQSSYTFSPLHRRFLDFKDAFNESKSESKERIRLTRLNTAKSILYVYYNQYYNAELKNWGNQNPELLPVLSINNGELAERVGVDANSTIWRASDFLLKLDLGENRGVFMTKKLNGWFADYEISINPYILTGQFVPNWGKNIVCDDVEIFPKETEENEEKNPKKVMEAAVATPALIANCNPPTTARTFVSLETNEKTTTSLCSNVEKCDNEQEQRTGTEGGSTTTNWMLKAWLEQQGRAFEKPTQGGDESTETARVAKLKANYGIVDKPETRMGIQDNSEKTIGRNSEIEQNEEFLKLRSHGIELTKQFFAFAMPLLYPHYKFITSQQNKILNLIYANWFRSDVYSTGCTIEYLNQHFENMKECVVIALQEVHNNKFSYIHGNPMEYFNQNFKHGFKRAALKFREKGRNRDRAVLLKAKKSISSGKIPRNIKNLLTLQNLIAYWKKHIERTCQNSSLMLIQLNLFLSDPNNLPKNGTKIW